MTTPEWIAAEVLRLYHVERWRRNTIARQLGIHHSAVARILARNGAKLPPPTRTTKVDKYMPLIRETLERYPTLCATRLLEMCRARGYAGKITQLRAAVRRLRPRVHAVAYLRLRTLPGEQAQVDWADFGGVVIGRARRRLMAFVMVLSWSRAVFVRFYYDARMPNFLAGHVHGFAFFGGVVRVVLYDNLKSAVLERQGTAIRLNPMLVQLSGHYRYEPRPVAPFRGNEKGRVERTIRYLRESFFAGREYVDLDDLNTQVLDFCRGLAAARSWPHDRTRTVGSAYDEERPQLLPLPSEPFPCAAKVAARAGKTPYVRFDRNDYSVPHTHVRKELVVVADETRVRIVDGVQVIAEHRRSYDAGAIVEDAAHVAALRHHKAAAREHGALPRLYRAVPRSEEYLRALAERGEPLARSVRALEEMLDEYGLVRLAAAIDDALARELVYLPALRKALLQHPSHRASGELPERLRAFIVHPHALSTYDKLHIQEDDDDGEDT